MITVFILCMREKTLYYLSGPQNAFICGLIRQRPRDMTLTHNLEGNVKVLESFGHS
jgi:hypothetical protein